MTGCLLFINRVLYRGGMYMSTKFRITNGPSKADLFAAVQYAYDKQNPHVVRFELNHDATIVVRLVAIENEDGSGYKFNLRGYITKTLSGENWPAGYVPPDYPKEYASLRMFYDSAARTGVIQRTGLDFE